jgi:phage replication-related protein YjqB (UPF0714/DUF867 family)
MTAGKYASFGELAQHELHGTDFRVRRMERAGSRVIILAPHGGKIEEGTSEIAALIAGSEHSLFCFEGLKPFGGNRDLHITSHRFDHPECLDMAARRDIIVSVHGCIGRERIFVGGLDTELSGRLSIELASEGYTVVGEGHRYPGRHPLNICNRGRRGKGAQLEITHDLREPEHHACIARAVRAAIAGFSDALPRESGPRGSHAPRRAPPG